MHAQYLYYPYSLLSCVGLRLRPRYLCVHSNARSGACTVSYYSPSGEPGLGLAVGLFLLRLRLMAYKVTSVRSTRSNRSKPKPKPKQK
jgi:hypothetical protein